MNADKTPIAEDLRAQYAELKYRKTRGWCHSEVDDRKFLDPLHLIERISAAEQRERVLRDALEWALPFALKASDPSRSEDDVPSDEWLAKKRMARAALAPAQPAERSICPDCKSTTRSFRGHRGDEHGEWGCDNEWHAAATGKEPQA